MASRPLSDRFLVAFSFAGEHRGLVRAIAEAVEARLGRGTVFLDEWFEHYLAGADADLKLQSIYGVQAELVVLCVSQRYGGKPWTLAEHAAIRAREMRARTATDERERNRVLPIRVGDGEVPGILINTIVPDVRDRGAAQAAGLILDRLRLVAPSLPALCASAAFQALSDQLDAAYAEEERLLCEGADTSGIRARIVDLRRRIREGGHMRAGDFLLHGRYKLIEELGKGGFATIFKAFDQRQRCPVAIKVLHGQHAADQSRIARFARGARKMWELRHPGIVQVLDPHQVDEGHHFFVMEYLSGGDLAQAIEGGSVSYEYALDLILEIGEALAFAHGRGLIHRDVKPANIVLDAEGRPKLTDFDLVRAKDTTAGTTRMGGFGTFAYAAPEMFREPQNADVRADVYGLGATTVFALCGVDPDPFEVWHDPVAFVADLPVSGQVRAVLARALARRRDDRFESMRAFCDALSEARRDVRDEPVPTSDGPFGQGPKPAPASVIVHPDARPTPFRDGVMDGSAAGPEMIWLPGGTSRVGSPEGVGNNDEHPAHEVTLSHYAVGQHPVTVGDFRRFVEATGYRTEAEAGDGAYVYAKDGWGQKGDASWRNPYLSQDDAHPVICVSWNDAKAYCRWLTEQTGQTYGLLTEAQWEHACRAGSGTAYCFGDDAEGLDAYAWLDRNAGDGTRAVGMKTPNAWQLHDMHGNVWEWCQDWFSTS